jgi:hypothetical protein
MIPFAKPGASAPYHEMEAQAARGAGRRGHRLG